MRQKGIKTELISLPNDFNEPSRAVFTYDYVKQEEKTSIQGNVELEEDGKVFFESFKQSLKQDSTNLKSEAISTNLLEFSKQLSNLDISESSVLKVTPGRSYSLDLSPQTTSILACSGDKEGNLGIWNYREGKELSEADLFQQRIHSDSISSAYFSRTDPSKLFTTSYDGRATIFDAQKMTFTEYYNTKDRDLLLFDVVVNNDAKYLACSDGFIRVVDSRTNSLVSKHRAHEKKLNSIEKNRVNENYLVTASLDRTIAVWDTRKIKKEVKYLSHRLAISHADFSSDGKSIVSLCNDDYIHCFDFTNNTLNEEGTEMHSFRHNNKTGRWLTRFKLNFNQNNYFVVGSMDQPRCVEVFNVTNKCRRVMRLRSDIVRSVQSLNKFHDSLNIIASVNAAGKVHIWS